MIATWRKLIPILFQMKTASTTTTSNININIKSSMPLCGCDTFVAFPPATAPGTVVFGKNSDRPNGEGQSITRYPAKTSDPQRDLVKCTYISIPQVEKTYAVLLSQIDWMWGAEMGANECGVVIGNEAVWTKEPCSSEEKYLLGMDLVRLGLERASSAREAVHVITNLLEEHGQGGPCAEDDASFTYHNSFLIVDKQEAWILETAGKHWVAERVTSGIRNISNCLSIRTKFDLSSKNIVEYAKQKGYWKYKDTDGDDEQPFDFASAFSSDHISPKEKISDHRFCGGRFLLEQQAKRAGTLNKDSMINILKDHDHGICMHGGFETTSAWVSEIYIEGGGARHWVTGQPHPCKSPFKEESVSASSSS